MTPIVMVMILLFAAMVVSTGTHVEAKKAHINLSIPLCPQVLVHGKLVSTSYHETEGNVSAHARNCA